jgi:hypothetical protein
MKLAIPTGWDYDHSLSAAPNFVADGDMRDRMRFLRHENGKDVYLEVSTGKELFVARPRAEDRYSPPFKHEGCPGD